MGYIKRNSFGWWTFTSLNTLVAHFEQWMRDAADVGGHGTTGEQPELRYEHDETANLKSLTGRTPHQAIREVRPKAQRYACIELDAHQ